MEYFIVKKDRVKQQGIDISAFLCLGDVVVLNQTAVSAMYADKTKEEFIKETGAICCLTAKETKEKLKDYE